MEMLTLVTTNSSEILRQVAAMRLELGKTTHEVAKTGPEALRLISERRPRVAVLDHDLPGLDAFEVASRVKADAELKSTRVIIVFSGPVSAADAERFASAHCDDAFSLPAPAGELYEHIAMLCGLPARTSRRIAVELRVELDAGTRTLRGRIVNLSRDGAKLEIDDPVGSISEVRLRIYRAESERAAFMRGQVVWKRKSDTNPDATLLGLKFSDLAPEVRSIVDDLALWEVHDTDGVCQVLLQGDFTELTDFGPLHRHLHSGTVEFDLSAVRYMNSSGLRNWITFLRRLTHIGRYFFVRCSAGFIHQASMAPDVLCDGKVLSLWAPYYCETCDRNDQRLLPVDALVAEGQSGSSATVKPLQFSCPSCQGTLVFDELPERYFSFLYP